MYQQLATFIQFLIVDHEIDVQIGNALLDNFEPNNAQSLDRSIWEFQAYSVHFTIHQHLHAGVHHAVRFHMEPILQQLRQQLLDIRKTPTAITHTHNQTGLESRLPKSDSVDPAHGSPHNKILLHSSVRQGIPAVFSSDGVGACAGAPLRGSRACVSLTSVPPLELYVCAGV